MIYDSEACFTMYIHNIWCSVGARSPPEKSRIETRFRTLQQRRRVMQKCVVLSASEAAAPELSPHFSVFYSVHLPSRWRIIYELRRQQMPTPAARANLFSYCESGPQLGVIFRCGRVVCKQGIKILPIPIYIFPHFRSRARRASLANTPPLQIIIILHATIERISARTLLYSESKNTKLYIPKSRAINPSRDNKFALFMNTLSRRRSFSACVIFSHSFKRLHAGWTL